MSLSGLHITVEVKNNYGSEHIYPLCSDAKLFARLAGTKTLTRESIECIKALGFDVIVEQPKVSL
jgi:hypothetical protein